MIVNTGKNRVNFDFSDRNEMNEWHIFGCVNDFVGLFMFCWVVAGYLEEENVQGNDEGPAAAADDGCADEPKSRSRLG